MFSHVPASAECLALAYTEGGSSPKSCAFRMNEKQRPAQTAKKPGLRLGWVFARLSYQPRGYQPRAWLAICSEAIQKRKEEMPFLDDFKIRCHHLSWHKRHMAVTAPNT